MTYNPTNSRQGKRKPAMKMGTDVDAIVGGTQEENLAKKRNELGPTHEFPAIC